MTSLELVALNLTIVNSPLIENPTKTTEQQKQPNLFLAYVVIRTQAHSRADKPVEK